MDLTLHEITEKIQCRVSGELAPANLVGISTDSRHVKPGELFLALRGDNFDGHAFVGTALDNGAVAALVDKNWAAGQDVSKGTFIIVEDTLDSYQKMARYYRQKMNPTVVALTGSAGKTTTKEYVAAVLSQKFNVHRNSKSFNNHVGVPATLLALQPEHEILVAELGTSNFGEISNLSYLVEPDVCLLLNIGYAHLEFLKSLAGVATAKMEIFDHAAADNTALVNADDAVLARQEIPSRNMISFGVNSGDVRAEHVTCRKDGSYSFRVGNVVFELAVPGRHNIYNVLAAIAVGLHFNVALEQCKAAIESVAFIEHRMNVLRINNKIIIDDVYNANPGSCRAALETLADIKGGGGRRIAVLGDMLELGEFSHAEHEKLATVARDNKVDALFLLGEHSKATGQKARDYDFIAAEHFESFETLIAKLRGFIQEHDVILVKGSRSMHMENVVNALHGEPA